METAVGGMHANSASSLPRNERQARYIKSKHKETCKTDPVSALLDMQLEEEKALSSHLQLIGTLPSLYFFQMNR